MRGWRSCVKNTPIKRQFSSLQDFVPPSTEEPTRFQLWRLMQIFGHHIGMAKALPFKPTLNIVEGQ